MTVERVTGNASSRRASVVGDLAHGLLCALLLFTCDVVRAGCHWVDAGDCNAYLSQLKARAEEGKATAQIKLGDMYRYGWFVPADGDVAMKWYRLAAEQGSAYAQYEVGVTLHYGSYDGLTSPVDREASLRWLEIAANKDHAGARYLLGRIHDEGDGVPEDDGIAAKWYTLVAEQEDVWVADWENVVAILRLAAFHRDGSGVEKDAAAAARWLMVAAERGRAFADDGRWDPYGVDTGYIEARDATMPHYLDAQYALGEAYSEGLGVPQDDEAALEWFGIAAKYGHEAAKRRLAAEGDDAEAL